MKVGSKLSEVIIKQKIHSYEDVEQMIEDYLIKVSGPSGSLSSRSNGMDRKQLQLREKKKAEMIKKNEEKKEKKETIAMKVRRSINLKVTSQLLGYNNKKK